MGEVVSKKTKLEGYQLSVHGLKYVIYGRITKAQRFSFDTSCSYKEDTFFDEWGIEAEFSNLHNPDCSFS